MGEELTARRVPYYLVSGIASSFRTNTTHDHDHAPEPARNRARASMATACRFGGNPAAISRATKAAGSNRLGTKSTCHSNRVDPGHFGDRKSVV